MSIFKKTIIYICVCLLLACAGFGGGYYVCNRGWSSRATDSGANLRADLDRTAEQLSLTKQSLDSANGRVAELESSISGAIATTEQNNKFVADAQSSIRSSTGTVEELEQLISEYFSLTEKLEANNRGLEERLRASLGADAGEQ